MPFLSKIEFTTSLGELFIGVVPKLWKVANDKVKIRESQKKQTINENYTDKKNVLIHI